jgi:type II restriction enzyme
VDRFYKEITGIEDAFYQICMQLPLTLEKIIASSDIGEYEKDSVIEELKKKNPDLLKALYMLAFEHYEGFGAL